MIILDFRCITDALNIAYRINPEGFSMVAICAIALLVLGSLFVRASDNDE